MRRRRFIALATGLSLAGCARPPAPPPPATPVVIPPPAPAPPPPPPPTIPLRADRIVVHKAEHRMTLFRGDVPVKSYAVALGRGGLAPKQRQGDRRTPEGRYRIVGRNPHSEFHRSLRLSYPEPHEIAAARARGDRPGGDIMIHGLRPRLAWIGALHRRDDWTDGCIAVTNEEIDEIWDAVADGTPVEILP